MRNLIVEKDAFVINDNGALQVAIRLLKRYNNATLLLRFWNGTDLFIKKDSNVRVSTLEEWISYMKLRENKIKNLQLNEKRLKGCRDAVQTEGKKPY